VGTSFTVFVGNGLLMNWYYYKHIGLDIKRFWLAMLRIAVGMAVPLAVAIVMSRNLDITTVPQLLGWGVAIALLEAVFLWFVAINKEDREMFAGPILRRLRRGSHDDA
ncbi:MAG: hypothetical protein IJC52_02680, partial [Clostridia bacterium]|nr:hypothetical protein [Clostridia bacterium]